MAEVFIPEPCEWICVNGHVEGGCGRIIVDDLHECAVMDCRAIAKPYMWGYRIFEV